MRQHTQGTGPTTQRSFEGEGPVTHMPAAPCKSFVRRLDLESGEVRIY